MSLKTALSSLLDCFVSKAGFNTLFDQRLSYRKSFIAQQALPANNSAGINVPLQNVDGWTYVPPADGYLKADVYSADQVFLHSGLLSYVDGGDRKGVFIPMRKGDVVSVGTANYQSGSNLTFFPLIGGGYLSSLVKSLCGGGLCLLSHLSRACSIFSQEKPISMGTFKQPPQIGQQHNFHRTGQTSNTLLSRKVQEQSRRRETAGSDCSQTAIVSIYKRNLARLLFRWLKRTTSRLRSPSEKVGTLATHLQPQHSLTRAASLFQASAKAKLATGGAL